MTTPTRHRRGRRLSHSHLLAIAIVGGSLAGGAGRSAQARSYVNQGLNLPGGTAELGVGLGLGHRQVGDETDYTGLGLNLEFGYGLRSDIELRLRTGLRFGNAGRLTDADAYGRPVETETYYTGGDTLANPEIGLRYNLVRGGTAEVALDGRVILPIDDELGVLVGLPVAFHLARARIDTGLYVPILFGDDDTYTQISLPLHLWFKLDGGTFLGVLTGVLFHDGGGESVPFGVGGGTSLAYDADLRFWFLFPDVSEEGSAKSFGLGAGLYVTF